ncbi:MAG TPA: hypothetical protein VNH20_04740 [Candidatus Dormibacteraeota bacterium]|nr:hypothetical protein [Candidatus Dormibacteraeota bacterium]
MTSQAKGPTVVRDRGALVPLHISANGAAAAGILGYLAVVALLFHLLWAGGSGIAGFPPDNQQHVWELGWWAFALTHGINPFFTTYLTPPGHPINLMWNNTTPLVGVLALPLTLLAGPVTSFNVSLILAVWLTATSAFLCLRDLTGNALGAWAGGLLFGFSPFMISNASSGRIPWSSLYLLPIFLWLFWRLLGTRQGTPWRLGVGLGATVAAQLLLSEELLTTTALVVVLMSILLALSHRDQVQATIRFAGPALLLAAGIALLLCAYPLYMQFAGPGHSVHGTVIPVQNYVAGLLGPLVPTHYQLLNLGSLFGGLQRLEVADGITAAYVGVPLLLVIGYFALRHHRDPLTWWALVLVLVAFVVSLGSQLHVVGSSTGIPMPWDLLHRLPLLSLVAPGRVVVFAYLGIAVVIARWGTLARFRRHLGVNALVAGAVLATLAPSGALPTTQLVIPQLWRASSATRPALGAVVALVPPPIGSADGQDNSMVWQAEAGFRFRIPWGNIIQASGQGSVQLTVNSALGGALIALEEGGRAGASTQALIQMRDELRAWQVTAVVVGPTTGRSQIVHLLEEVLGSAPRQVGGTQLWTLPSPGPR